MKNTNNAFARTLCTLIALLIIATVFPFQAFAKNITNEISKATNANDSDGDGICNGCDGPICRAECTGGLHAFSCFEGCKCERCGVGVPPIPEVEVFNASFYYDAAANISGNPLTGDQFDVTWTSNEDSHVTFPLLDNAESLTFVGWKSTTLSSGDTLYEGGRSYKLVNADMAFVGQWQQQDKFVAAFYQDMDAYLDKRPLSGSKYNITWTTEDNSAILPVISDTINKRFDGWNYYPISGSPVFYTAGEMTNLPSINMDFVMKCTDKNPITVSYLLNGGEWVGTAPVDEELYGGNTYTVSSITPQNSGKAFLGWKASFDNAIYSTSEAGKNSSFILPSDTSEITLTAQWSSGGSSPNEYTALFNANGGSFKSTNDELSNISSDILSYSFLSGDSLDLSTITKKLLQRKDYIIIGWHASYDSDTDDDTENDTYTTNAVISLPEANVTFTAQWIQKESVEVIYELKYDEQWSDNRQPPADKLHTYLDGSYTIIDATYNPVKSGSNFFGWKYLGRTYRPGEIIEKVTETNSGSITLTAVWSKMIAITYDIGSEASWNKGENPDSSSEGCPIFVLEGSAFKITSYTPKRQNHTFVEWRSNDLAYQPDDELLVLASDIVLSAKWSLNKYSGMIYQYPSDPSPAAIGWNAIEPYLFPEPIEREGYSFLHWAAKTEDGSIIGKDNIYYIGDTFIGAVNSRLIVTGIWEAVEYKIRYLDSSGAVIEGLTAISSIEKNLIRIPQQGDKNLPTLEHHNLIGFVAIFDLPSYKAGTTIPLGSIITNFTIKGDVTLLPVFDFTGYVIRFVDHTDKLISMQILSPGEIPAIPDNPIRKPSRDYTYTFAGWSPEVTAAVTNATYKATFDMDIIYTDKPDSTKKPDKITSIPMTDIYEAVQDNASPSLNDKTSSTSKVNKIPTATPDSGSIPNSKNVPPIIQDIKTDPPKPIRKIVNTSNQWSYPEKRAKPNPDHKPISSIDDGSTEKALFGIKNLTVRAIAQAILLLTTMFAALLIVLEWVKLASAWVCRRYQKWYNTKH